MVRRTDTITLPYPVYGLGMGAHDIEQSTERTATFYYGQSGIIKVVLRKRRSVLTGHTYTSLSDFLEAKQNFRDRR